jgi:hypothetical protein
MLSLAFVSVNCDGRPTILVWALHAPMTILGKDYFMVADYTDLADDLLVCSIIVDPLWPWGRNVLRRVLRRKRPFQREDKPEDQ